MVGMLDSGLRCPSSTPGQGHYVVFFGKTIGLMISEMPQAYVLKQGQVQNLSCGNNFLLSCK